MYFKDSLLYHRYDMVVDFSKSNFNKQKYYIYSSYFNDNINMDFLHAFKFIFYNYTNWFTS